MSVEPSWQLLLAALAEREPDRADAVLRRVGAIARGSGKRHLAGDFPLPDVFVAAVARVGEPEELAELARNPCLTPSQLMVLVRAGGDPVVRAVFTPSESAWRDDSDPFDPYAVADDTEPTDWAGSKDPYPGARYPTPLDKAWLAIRDPECPADRAVELLEAYPLLGYSARVPRQAHDRGPSLVRLLHHGSEPWPSVTAVAPAAERALAWGALPPGELARTIRPALVSAQTLAQLARGNAKGLGTDAAVAAVVRPLLHGTVKADPGAWAALAQRLERSAGTLAEALAEAAERPAEGLAEGSGPAEGSTPDLRITASGKTRPALLFLLRCLDATDIEALLPHLDDSLADNLIQGHIPVPAALLELAHRTGHRLLLRKIAGHQHLRDEPARRIQAYEDPELDRLLAWNTSGVSSSVRREVFAGISPSGGPRRPMDERLRQMVLESPDHTEHTTIVHSGDPVLVCAALPKCRKLRRIDLIDVVRSLWDRNGTVAVEAVLTSVPDVFPKPVRTVIDHALATGSPAELDTARAKWDRSAKPGTVRTDPAAKLEQWRLPPEQRIRDHEFEANRFDRWLLPLPADVPVAVGRPAAEVLAALDWWCEDGRAPEAREALAEAVIAPLGTAPEAWAVFVQLLPDFVGTLPELATLAAAAAHE